MHYMHFYYYTLNTDSIFHNNNSLFVKNLKEDSSIKQKKNTIEDETRNIEDKIEISLVIVDNQNLQNLKIFKCLKLGKAKKKMQC